MAFRYALTLVREQPEDYEPGDVMTILFAVIVGGMSLGQTAPNFPAFAAGRVAGGRLLHVIERQSLIDMNAAGTVPDVPLKVRPVYHQAMPASLACGSWRQYTLHDYRKAPAC